MMIIGPISSIYDFLTFGVLLWAFHASTNAPLFHTGWFVESLATQTLVVFVIRTAGNPLESRPSRALLVAVFATVAVAAVLPYTALGKLLQLTPLPLSLLGAIAFLAVTYLLLVSFKSPLALSDGRFSLRLQDKLQETQHGFQTEFNRSQFSK
jgi:Mg2+-importing ATPase